MVQWGATDDLPRDFAHSVVGTNTYTEQPLRLQFEVEGHRGTEGLNAIIPPKIHTPNTP